MNREELAILAAVVIGCSLVAFGIFGEWRYAEMQAILGDHNYGGKDCMNATADIWADLEAGGFQAEIPAGWAGFAWQPPVGGINHVWLTVELMPGIWVPVESTTGQVIPEEVIHYYHEVDRFQDPAAMRAAYLAGPGGAP